ncbi:MAG: glycosyltransferase WbuB [Rhodospirillales bacterium]|nr:MAG: glycosyltransferase WbuB [Rhodospirillales bacterium]
MTRSDLATKEIAVPTAPPVSRAPTRPYLFPRAAGSGKRLKILFLSHYFPPEVNAPASRTYEHCRRWAEAGHDVTVLTCNPNCPDGVLFPGYRNRVRVQREVVDGIRVVRMWTFLAANAGTVKRVANYISFLCSAVLAAPGLDRPDVVVATSPQFFCGWAGVAVARLKRVPLVLEIRDIWPESIVATGAMGKTPFLLGLVQRMADRMYRSADRIVAVGDGYRSHILATVPDLADLTEVITNGVDLRFFSPEREGERPTAAELRQRWNLGDRFVCAYVGTIGMAHRLEVTLEAARLLKAKGRRDIVFLNVGDGAERKRLETDVAAAGLVDWVVFTGRQPKEMMPPILAMADACLVHLRKCDLFTSVIPSKIFETMAMGRPMVMGVEGQARDLVIGAGAGIAMEPESAESLVAAVEALADDAALRARLGDAGRGFVAHHYDRDDLARRYLDVLTEVVAAKRRAVADVR